MNLWITILSVVKRQNPDQDQEERLRRLERNEKRIVGLNQRAERIMNENHLSMAIRRALEGR